MKIQWIVFALPLCLGICLILAMINVSCSHQPKLKRVFRDSFTIGTALNEDQIFEKDAKAVMLMEEHFNSITAENAMKWGPVHPKPDEYHFEPADRFVALGEKNKMFIIGHTLVWHAQTPGWVFHDSSGEMASRELLLERMREHIHTVVGRYKGRVHGWDVVNEALEDDGQLRKSPWLRIIGEDYIQFAFQYAHEADPDAELYYNDYNMWKSGKVEGAVRLVKELQSKGIPLHGIGEQGHWGLDYPPLGEMDAAFRAFSRLGVKVMITELDVNVLPNPAHFGGADISTNFELQKEFNPYAGTLPDSMQQVLSQRYADFFKLFLKYKPISRVTFWGVHDGQSWLNNWPIRGRTNYPLLFDRQLLPKPAFDAVIETAGEGK